LSIVESPQNRKKAPVFCLSPTTGLTFAVPDFFAICQPMPAPPRQGIFAHDGQTIAQTFSKTLIFKTHLKSSPDSSQKARGLPHSLPKGNISMIKTAILMGLLLLAPAALAQDLERRGEVFGSLGGGKVYDDEGSLGKGFDIGGGVGFRLTPKVGIEGQVNRIDYERNFASGVRFAGTAVFTTANLLYHFSTSKVQPYVVGGVGFMHHENRSRFPENEVLPKRTANSFATSFGGGVKIFLNQKFSVRPEVRVFLGDTAGSGVEPPFSLGRASLGFTYHW
jgi:opacity protein-like surface antigen